MDKKLNASPSGHIVFDHDGTLVKTDIFPYLLFDGMAELLNDLKTQGFELYVWTSRPRKSTQDSLKRFEIQQYFKDIFCYDDGLHKPNPMGLECLTVGIPKNKILHIGDSLADLEGARAYGIGVVLACWNNPDQVQIDKEKYNGLADYYASDLMELRTFIKGKFYV